MLEIAPGVGFFLFGLVGLGKALGEVLQKWRIQSRLGWDRFSRRHRLSRAV